MPSSQMRVFLRGCLAHWRLFVTYLAPLLLLPLPFIFPGPASRCGYVLLLMAIYWLSECIPCGLTGMIPALLLPFLGVMSIKEVCVNYWKETSFLFVGMLCIAALFEKTGLHMRIALRVMTLVGERIEFHLAGFMLVTWFLSFWMANTAATALMLPIAEAVIKQHSKNEMIRRSSALQLKDSSPSGASLSPREIPPPSTQNEINRPQTESQTPAITNGKEDGETPQAQVRFELGVGDLQKDGAASNSKPEVVAITMSNEKEGHTSADGGNEPGGSRVAAQEECVVLIEPAAPNPAQGASSDAAVTNSISSKEPEKKASSPQDEYKSTEGKMILMSIAYSSSIGGFATLTGSGTNLVLMGTLSSMFKTDGGVGFGSWLLFGLPMATLMIVLSWIWLVFYFMGWKSILQLFRRAEHVGSLQEVLKVQYKKLGPMKPEEIAVVVLLILTVLAWITREQGHYGWAQLFPAGYTSDALPAIAVLFAAFLIPNLLFSIFKSSNPAKAATDSKATHAPEQGGHGKAENDEFFVTWKLLEKSVPWGILFMIGGAFAISDASVSSGLAATLGEMMSVMSSLPSVIVVLIIILLSTIATQITANMAMCSILLPIVIKMAQAMGMNPIYLALPTAFACSFAFCLPMGTPPNLFVYSKGFFTQIEMVKAGLGITVIGIVILWVSINTYAFAIFDLKTLPPWATVAPTKLPASTTFLSGFNATTIRF